MLFALHGEPWGTPLFISTQSLEQPIVARYIPFIRYERIHISLDMQYICSLQRKDNVVSNQMWIMRDYDF